MALHRFDLDRETADSMLARVDLGLRAEEITRLAGGILSSVFDVRTNDGRSLVVKIYPEEVHSRVEKEVFVYELLRRHALAAPVPEILAAEDSKSLLGQSVVVMTKLNGEHVSAFLDRLDDVELAHVNRQIGSFLRSLHEVTFDQFGYVDAAGVVKPHETNLAYMRFQFDEKLREFAALGGDGDLRRKIEPHVAEHEELLTHCLRPSCCHNDCHYGNVLALPSVDGWRVSGILDFENVLAGDPLLDLAKAHCYSRRRSEMLLAALVEGYGNLRPDWRQSLDLYILYHWLELWDWLASLGQADQLYDVAREMRRLIVY